MSLVKELTVELCVRVQYLRCNNSDNNVIYIKLRVIGQSLGM